MAAQLHRQADYSTLLEKARYSDDLRERLDALESDYQDAQSQIARLRDELKVTSSYVKTVEEQSRASAKKASELERDLASVKQECVQAIQAKEAALNHALARNESLHQAALKEADALRA